MPFVFHTYWKIFRGMVKFATRLVISQVYSYGSNVARQTAVLSDWYAVRLSEMVLGR